MHHATTTTAAVPAHVSRAQAFRARAQAATAEGTPQAWLDAPRSADDEAEAARAVASSRAFRARVAAHVAATKTRA